MQRKMKRSLALLVAAACLFAGCSRSLRFTVESDVNSLKLPVQTDTIMIEYETMTAPVKVPVKKDAFTIKGKVDKPIIAQIRGLNQERKTSRTLILEKGTISFQDGLPCGTPLNDAVSEFTRDLMDYLRDHRKDPDAREQVEEKFFSFVARHKDDPCAVYAILFAKRILPKPDLERLIHSASAEVQNNGDIRSMVRKMNNGLPNE